MAAASYSSIDSAGQMSNAGGAESWQSMRSVVGRRSSIVVTDADDEILPPASPPLPSYARLDSQKPESAPIAVPVRRLVVDDDDGQRIHPTTINKNVIGSPDSAHAGIVTRSTRLPVRSDTNSFSPIAAAYVMPGSVPASIQTVAAPIGLRRAASTPTKNTTEKSMNDSKTADNPTTITVPTPTTNAGRGYWQSFGLSATPRPLSKAMAGALAGFAPPLTNTAFINTDTDFTEAVVVSSDGKRSDVDVIPTTTTTTMAKTNIKPTVRGVRFNASSSRFVAATSTGFIVFDSGSFKRLFSRSLNDAGLSIAELIDETNIMAFVGGGPNPYRPPHTVVLWNDHLQKQIGSVSQREPILAVRISRNRLVTVVERTVHVYRLRDFRHVDSISTATNPDGLIAFSESAADAAIVIVPAVGIGSVAVVQYDADDRPAMSILKAHKSAVNCLSLSGTGRWLATASDTGTLVRLFDVKTHSQKREFRRGTLPGRVCSLSFSGDERWLAAGSTGGTVHVFALPDQVENTASKFAFLKNLSYLPSVAAAYFSSEWSFATFRLPEPSMAGNNNNCIVGFGAQAGVVLAVSSTAMYRGMFNTKTRADHVLALSMQPILADD